MEFPLFSLAQVYFGDSFFAESKGDELAVPALFESKISVNPQNPVGRLPRQGFVLSITVSWD